MRTQSHITLLTRLIEHHTENPGGDEPAICHFLRDELEKRGAGHAEVVTVPRTRSNEVGAYVFATFGEPRLLVNVHVDTVPANSGWTQDPWTPTITADRVIGLGAADTKGAIATILTALETTTPQNVGFLFSGDEEKNTSCIRAFLASERTRGITRAIVCEPTNRVAGVRHRGINGYRAEFQGQGGHSSNADRMPKPIATLARLAAELDSVSQQYLSQGPEDMKGICMNVASLEGGVAFNVVPDAATLTWSIRPPQGFDQQQFDEKVRDTIQRTNAGITLTTLLQNPPFSTHHLAKFEQMLGSHVRTFSPLQFWTEAAMLSEAGIDAVVIGPGNIEQAHAADEWVSQEDLIWAIELFTHIFKETAHDI